MIKNMAAESSFADIALFPVLFSSLPHLPNNPYEGGVKRPRAF
jgi:hypothetical protein